MPKSPVLVLVIALLPLTTAGCISTAASIVKAPFKAANQAVDWSTTSQEESDRNYGRKMRKQEAQEGRERKERDKHCRSNPDSSACKQYQGYRAGY